MATASFVGAFSGFGAYRLSVDFENLVLGDMGAAGASLAITLVADAITLLDVIIDATDAFDFDFALAVGANGLLDLTLFSTAASDLGNGFNLASVGFDLQSVPEPTTATLFVLGALVARYRRRAI